MAEPKDLTILVVDDEPDIVTYLRMLLEDSGFQVMDAGNGEEAMERVTQRRPDLISLDLVMPKKSGIRFFYELRKDKELAKIPVIIVTGHARDEKVRKEMDDLFAGKTISGPQIYLEKPVKPPDYINLVKRVLGIETGPDEQGAGADSENLRGEAARLIESADPEALRQALEVLRQKKK